MSETCPEWSPTFPLGDKDVAIPEDAVIVTGSLEVPGHLPRYGQAWMEEAFREVLWPPCSVLGRKRWGRRFTWTDQGRVLHYQIIDVPAYIRHRKAS